MSSKLKAITTRAKQLYKTGKFAKWTDAIKEASKSLTKGKKVSGVKKAVKKKAVKKATKKKATPKSYHKDTKSHNVNIKVVSGIKGLPIEFTMKEAQEYTTKRGKNTKFYYNVFGWTTYFTLKPTFATPTGKAKGFPRIIIFKP